MCLFYSIFVFARGSHPQKKQQIGEKTIKITIRGELTDLKKSISQNKDQQHVCRKKKIFNFKVKGNNALFGAIQIWGAGSYKMSD